MWTRYTSCVPKDLCPGGQSRDILSLNSVLSGVISLKHKKYDAKNFLTLVIAYWNSPIFSEIIKIQPEMCKYSPFPGKTVQIMCIWRVKRIEALKYLKTLKH